MKAYYRSTGLGVLCGLVGMTRQAYYDHTWRLEKAELASGVIVELVKRERKIAKGVGSKKLYQILKEELLAHQIKIGRDKFHEVLRDHNLLVCKKRKSKCTTMSRHRLKKYPNIASGLAIEGSEQLWVSDITYLNVGNRHGYLILITDAYSRKVVGYNFGEKMDAAFCVQALEGALSNRFFPERDLMHHSDRGLQYCSKAYVDKLRAAEIKISMTENGDPLENALAERMNSIFKSNFGLDEKFESFEQARRAIDAAIEYYNSRLPHSSVDMLTPNEAHMKTGKLKRHWRWYWKEKQEQINAAVIPNLEQR